MDQFASEYSPGEGLDRLAFRVEDLDDAVARFAEAGHPVVLGVKSWASRWA